MFFCAFVIQTLDMVTATFASLDLLFFVDAEDRRVCVAVVLCL
ncbi:hypothetical protein RAJCM14343_3964 [Rhodococcus aetherivorans]|uniref:Uncharacterized protein n=1 Tax=Rhodococcus aetherivorans TaxID=191292 RepID=A0ABQ0YQG3_9NOCA|nr:hypothetical protein RAJCM14343_3964 [Rhodococcus aetherivorans]